MNNPRHQAQGLLFTGLLLIALGMGVIGGVIYIVWSMFYG